MRRLLIRTLAVLGPRLRVVAAARRLRRQRHPADHPGQAPERRRLASFSQSPISPIGRLGDETLINGTHHPFAEVTDRLVRLRLLNASTARTYKIGFADGREFELIATEGGLLKAPRTVNRIQLSVGERAEIVVELRPGEEAVLRSFEPELGSNRSRAASPAPTTASTYSSCGARTSSKTRPSYRPTSYPKRAHR
jgi:FtsP/CotA-like multicopper oxidase with cupredoxin domain